MQKKIFLISAACFFVANNFHLIITSSLLPKIFDTIAMITLGFGIFVMLADKSEKG